MPSSSYLPLTGGDVHIVESGGTGRLILLVHGLGGQHTNWMAVSGALTALGRVVALDLPGYGLSPPRDRHGIFDYASVVAEVVAELGAPALLIGNSMGGLISEIVASRHPELVEGLVLIAPAARPDLTSRPPDASVAARLLVQSLPLAGPAFARAYRALLDPEAQALATLDIVSADRDRIPDEIVRASIAMSHTRRHMPWTVPVFAESARSIRRLFVRRGRYERIIRSIRCPVLVLSGTDDVVVPASSIAALLGLRPDWGHAVHRGTGHVPQMEEPRWVVEQIGTWLHHPETLARAT